MLDYGDVITFDFDRDGTIDHAAMVSGFDTDGWPLYAQHTPSKPDASLRAVINGGGGGRIEYWHLLGLNGF